MLDIMLSAKRRKGKVYFLNVNKEPAFESEINIYFVESPEIFRVPAR
jgi:hypothetical protein